MRQLVFLSLLNIILTASYAHAYGGPGSSLGAVLVVVGIVGTLFLSIMSFFWYPIKRFIRKIRTKNEPVEPGPKENDEPE